MLWSELLFTALCLLTLERLVAYRSGSTRALWMAVTAAALAALTRYAGVALILTGVLYLLSTPRRSWAQRLRPSLLFALAASLPLLLWMLRNLRIGEGLTGPRYPAMLNLRQVLEFMGKPLPRLYLPEAWSTWLPDTLWLLVFGLVWSVLFHLACRRRRAQNDPRHESAFILLLFVGVSFALLAAAISRSAMDRPNVRLLAPIVLPSLLGLALIISARKREGGRPLRPTIGLIVLGLLAVAGAVQLPAAYEHFRTRGAGYALPRFQSSGLAREIRLREMPGPLMSNLPDGVFYLCGRRALWPPREKAYQSHNLEIQTQELRRFERLVKTPNPSRGLFLAWFEESPPFLLELSTLRSIYQVMTPLAETEDGILLFVPVFEGSAVD